MARITKLACIVMVMCMVVITPMAEAAISCGTVTAYLSPCLGYLTGGPGPLPPCCTGVRKLLVSAASVPDKQAACNCLKSAAGSIHNLNTNNAAALPGRCGVNIPYKISTSTNCNTIKF